MQLLSYVSETQRKTVTEITRMVNSRHAVPPHPLVNALLGEVSVAAGVWLPTPTV